MSLDYSKLVPQGRAKAFDQPWSQEEQTALITLYRERKLHRTIAADYIRNGIMTLEDYDKAVAKKFKPLNLNEAKEKADKDLKDRGAKAVRAAKKKTSKSKK